MDVRGRDPGPRAWADGGVAGGAGGCPGRRRRRHRTKTPESETGTLRGHVASRETRATLHGGGDEKGTHRYGCLETRLQFLGPLQRKRFN